MLNRKRMLLTAALAVVGVSGYASAITWTGSSGQTIDFLQDFSADPGKATGSVSGSDYDMVFTGDSSAALTNYANSSTTGAGFWTTLNANSAPWFELTFVDNKNDVDDSWSGLEMFINGPGSGSSGARGKVGATFPEDAIGNSRWRTEDNPGSNNVTGFGNTAKPIPDGATVNGFFAELKYSSGGTRSTPSYAVTSGDNNSTTSSPSYGTGVLAGIANNTAANLEQRVAGDLITVRFGEYSDGTVEFTVLRNNVLMDQWTNDFWVNAGIGFAPFYQVEWRVLGGQSGETYEFKDLRWGNDYPNVPAIPEPASMALLALGTGLALFRRSRG